MGCWGARPGRAPTRAPCRAPRLCPSSDRHDPRYFKRSARWTRGRRAARKSYCCCSGRPCAQRGRFDPASCCCASPAPRPTRPRTSATGPGRSGCRAAAGRDAAGGPAGCGRCRAASDMALIHVHGQRANYFVWLHAAALPAHLGPRPLVATVHGWVQDNFVRKVVTAAGVGHPARVRPRHHRVGTAAAHSAGAWAFAPEQGQRGPARHPLSGRAGERRPHAREERRRRPAPAGAFQPMPS